MKIFTYRNRLQLFFLLVLCVLGGRGYAQTPPTKQWDKTFGTTAFEYYANITRLTDGNFIVACQHTSATANGDKTMPSFGNNTNGDVWVHKLDPNGNTIWQKQYGTSAADFPMGLSAEKDGGFYIFIKTLISVDFTRTAPVKGVQDYWLVKCDADGNKLWDKAYGGTSSEEPTHGMSTSDGGFLMLGYSKSGIGGDKTEAKIGPANPDNDAWIVKVDANGNKIWDRTIGTTGSTITSAFEIPKNSLEVSDGYIVFFNYTRVNGSVGNITTTNKGLYDVWIAKLDKATGAIIWQKSIGTNAEDNDVQNPVATSDGGFLVPILTYSIVANGDKSVENATPHNLSGSTAYSDYWIVKLDANGDKVWDKTYGGSDDELPGGAVSYADGTALLYGISESTKSGLKTVDQYGTITLGGGLGDLWLVKIDADGNKLWDKAFGSSTNEGYAGSNAKYVTAIPMPDNSLAFALITGYIPNIDNDYDRTSKSEGFTDLWVLKTQPPQQADLAVTVSPATATGNQGAFLSYTVTVTNNGPHTAPNAMVQVPIPNGYTFLSATPSAGSYSYGTKVWTVGSLANGASATMVISIKVN